MLVLTPLPGIPEINPGYDLAKIILAELSQAKLELSDGDIIVIAQKIVSKAEGRLMNLEAVKASARAREYAAQCKKDPRLIELILQESNEVLRLKPGTIVVEHRLGFVCANAGIDHSNVGCVGDHSGDWVLLLPEDPDATAARIRESCETASGAHLGVMIIDSHGRAWRLGTTGVAIGFSGLPGVVDLRGKPDMFGYTLTITQVGVADELAAAASLVMGQADERTPVVHVRGFPYRLREAGIREMLRPKEEDLFR